MAKTNRPVILRCLYSIFGKSRVSLPRVCVPRKYQLHCFVRRAQHPRAMWTVSKETAKRV